MQLQCLFNFDYYLCQIRLHSQAKIEKLQLGARFKKIKKNTRWGWKLKKKLNVLSQVGYRHNVRRNAIQKNSGLCQAMSMEFFVLTQPSLYGSIDKPTLAIRRGFYWNLNLHLVSSLNSSLNQGIAISKKVILLFLTIFASN
jgi:hypothetical protein